MQKIEAPIGGFLLTQIFNTSLHKLNFTSKNEIAGRATGGHPETAAMEDEVDAAGDNNTKPKAGFKWLAYLAV